VKFPSKKAAVWILFRIPTEDRTSIGIHNSRSTVVSGTVELCITIPTVAKATDWILFCIPTVASISLSLKNNLQENG